ncbi:MAG: hypothetical protein JWS10_2493 [Cypionkella sp.]|nr:hypothetical protein [Cypionkella sp.]MDB5666937.1 hypothetical protein [Cypionkella sp.]
MPKAGRGLLARFLSVDHRLNVYRSPGDLILRKSAYGRA